MSNSSAILLPIYNDADGVTIRITYSGTDYDVTLTQGTYSSILTYLYDFVATINATAIPIDLGARLTSTGMVNIYSTGGQSFAIDFRDTYSQEICGFNSDSSAASSHTGNYNMYAWVSKNGPTNNSDWDYSEKSIISYSVAHTGRYSTIQIGDILYNRQFSFEAEDPENIMESRATSSTNSECCLQNMLTRSIISVSNIATAVNPRGLFYFPVWPSAGSDYVYTVDDMTDNCGVFYDLTSSPNTHTYCYYIPGSLKIKPYHTRTKQYCTCSFSLQTADEPNWCEG